MNNTQNRLKIFLASPVAGKTTAVTKLNLVRHTAIDADDVLGKVKRYFSMSGWDIIQHWDGYWESVKTMAYIPSSFGDWQDDTLDVDSRIFSYTIQLLFESITPDVSIVCTHHPFIAFAICNLIYRERDISVFGVCMKAEEYQDRWKSRQLTAAAKNRNFSASDLLKFNSWNIIQYGKLLRLVSMAFPNITVDPLRYLKPNEYLVDVLACSFSHTKEPSAL